MTDRLPRTRAVCRYPVVDAAVWQAQLNIRAARSAHGWLTAAGFIAVVH